MSELKKVNLFAGRFQPFHAGHLQCCSDAFKENGYPTVIMYIHNEKFDEKKPFDDSVIEKELEIVKKNCDFIEDVMWLKFPQPVRMCRVLQENGYQPVLWLSGEDRIENYRKMLNPTAVNKIQTELNMEVPELYQTKRYGSATAVRNAIKNNDKEEFKKLMPAGTDVLWNELVKQIQAIKESKLMKGISQYIIEKFNK